MKIKYRNRKRGTKASFILGVLLLASAFAVASQNIQITSQSVYLPYGGQSHLRSAQATLKPRPLMVGGQHYGYTGQAKDDSSSTQMLGGFRVYDSQAARFISPDTEDAFDHHTTSNAYAYVSANPLRYSDPSGHWAVADNAKAFVGKHFSRLKEQLGRLKGWFGRQFSRFSANKSDAADDVLLNTTQDSYHSLDVSGITDLDASWHSLQANSFLNASMREEGDSIPRLVVEQSLHDFKTAIYLHVRNIRKKVKQQLGIRTGLEGRIRKLIRSQVGMQADMSYLDRDILQRCIKRNQQRIRAEIQADIQRGKEINRMRKNPPHYERFGFSRNAVEYLMDNVTAPEGIAVIKNKMRGDRRSIND